MERDIQGLCAKPRVLKVLVLHNSVLRAPCLVRNDDVNTRVFMQHEYSIRRYNSL
jgi:hypothetical protein